MTFTIQKGDPLAPGPAALLDQSHALMQSLFPAEDNFYLDHAALTVPEITFFTATRGDETLGTAALADKGDYGEVKSMFVSTAARGLGVGAALLAQLEQQARSLGHTSMKLETGNALHAAHRLYEKAGFRLCGPFGNYPDAASSIFMEKQL